MIPIKTLFILQTHQMILKQKKTKRNPELHAKEERKLGFGCKPGFG